MANLKLTGIRKAYGAVEVLHGVDLEIGSGEFVVFVGPSGCGKSTLLRLIAGLEDITAGKLEFDGQTVNDLPPSKRGVAMVFQSYALYPHMTVYDNMAFGMRIARADKGEVDRRVREAAEMLQLSNLLDRLPRQLSGGQRQRVAIGRAIVRDPRVFLFDEPLSNLDAALRVATRIEIAKLKERMANTTMIYVTHDQVEAMTLADRIVVLRDGNVEQVGSPMELYKKPANLFVAQFIGSPSMNILPARIARSGPTTALALPGDRSIELPVATPGGQGDASVSFGVRPEDLIVAEGSDYLFEGTVDYVEQLGEVQLVYLQVSGHDQLLVAKLPGNSTVERGMVLKLKADPGELHIFDSNGRSFANAGEAARRAA